MLNLKYIIALLIVTGLLFSCSDDKSSTSPNVDNGTGSNGLDEKVVYTEFDYIIKSDLTGQVFRKRFTYYEEFIETTDFLTSTNFYKSKSELHWKINNISDGQSNFAVDFITPIKELKVGEYNLDAEEQNSYKSMVYPNGLSKDGSKATKSYFHIRTLKEIKIDSVDYALISGTGVMYLDLYLNAFEELVFYINFENVKVQISG